MGDIERDGTGDDDAAVLVVGDGVAGLTAALFTARAGLDTLVVGDGESILRRNAHLENYPGFPLGVNPRLFLEMVTDQAERAGARFADGRVESVERDESGFAVETTADTHTATRVVAASWADAGYLDGLDVDAAERGSKTFLRPDRDGRTGVEGLYAAGRLADQYHQTVVAAGDGARTAITLIHDSPVAFYHDWVAPEGYFTGRDREVPPGCEEIDEGERRRRERAANAELRERFAEPHPATPTMHPSVEE
jgi:thioredoxin reductase (NADPH)